MTRISKSQLMHTASALILTSMLSLVNPALAYAGDGDDGDETPKTNALKNLTEPQIRAELEADVEVAIEEKDLNIQAAQLQPQPSPNERFDTSTIIYGLGFIEQQSGVVTVADLVMRIPGGSAMLQGNNRNAQRGFGNGNDRILINGKRLSGKSNDSRSALAQMSVSQVKQVEFIRGSSPDVKVSGSGALINVVLKEDAGGSGSWKGFGLMDSFGNMSYNGRLSYASTVGLMDYNVSALYEGLNIEVSNTDYSFDGMGNATQILNETRKNDMGKYELKANLTFNLKDGDLIHLNGLYDNNDRSALQPGEFLNADQNGDLTISGSGLRLSSGTQSKFEIGGDYETSLSDNFSLKILGLHSETNIDNSFEEDFEIILGHEGSDFRSINDNFNSESIARATLGWDFIEGQTFEFGSEVALNKQVVNLQYFEREGGILVGQDVSASNVTIKEFRDESFINHSWKVSERLNIDSSVFFEYSKISQNGIGVSREKTFTYVKPSIDLRYDPTNQDQLTLGVRRKVSQLNFNDFASSVSEDDQVIGGNENLEPERSWQADISYEHRLKDDQGSLKLIGFYETFANKLYMIETQPGISGVGNVGKGKKYGMTLEGSLRFSFIGLPDMRLSGDFTIQDTEVTDPFTMTKEHFNFAATNITGSAELRHDIKGMGLSWGFGMWFNASHKYQDIDETVLNTKNRIWVSPFIEKQIGKSMVLMFEIQNLLDTDFGRNRLVYSGGRAGGILTSSTLREQSYSRRFMLELRGTF